MWHIYWRPVVISFSQVESKKTRRPRVLHSLERKETASTSEDSFPEPDERHV